jgi:hypothetical protein
VWTDDVILGIHCIYFYLFEEFLNIGHKVRHWVLDLGVGRSTLSSPIVIFRRSRYMSSDIHTATMSETHQFSDGNGTKVGTNIRNECEY